MCLHTIRCSAEFEFAAIAPALTLVRSNGRLNFLSKFHKLIQSSASHYTMAGAALKLVLPTVSEPCGPAAAGSNLEARVWRAERGRPRTCDTVGTRRCPPLQ